MINLFSLRNSTNPPDRNSPMFHPVEYKFQPPESTFQPMEHKFRPVERTTYQHRLV